MCVCICIHIYSHTHIKTSQLIYKFITSLLNTDTCIYIHTCTYIHIHFYSQINRYINPQKVSMDSFVSTTSQMNNPTISLSFFLLLYMYTQFSVVCLSSLSSLKSCSLLSDSNFVVGCNLPVSSPCQKFI